MESNFMKNESIEKFFDEEWLTAEELLSDPLLPTSVAGIHYRANKEGWVKRKRLGVKGGRAVEYHVSSLPRENQESLLNNFYLKQNDNLMPDRYKKILDSFDKGTKRMHDFYDARKPGGEVSGVSSSEQLLIHVLHSLPDDVTRQKFLSKVYAIASELLNEAIAVDEREILGKRNTNERTPPASSVGTHGKKAG